MSDGPAHDDTLQAYDEMLQALVEERRQRRDLVEREVRDRLQGMASRLAAELGLTELPPNVEAIFDPRPLRQP